MKRIYIFSFILFFCLAAESNSDVLIADLPAWVKVAKEIDDSKQQESSFGYCYLILDQQSKVDENSLENFVHVSKKILNSKGVDACSVLEFEYNPLYETITFHSILITRDGKNINKLNPANFKVIQREKNLENGVYTGNKSLSVILDDVRVGDVISYSYTIVNSNKNYCKMFYTVFSPKSVVPINCSHKRILWGNSLKEISIKNHLTNVKPIIQKHEDYKEYIWQKKYLDLVSNYEPYTPSWHDEEPWVEISANLTWQEVCAEMSKLYSNASLELPEQIKSQIDKIAQNKDLGKRFIEVVRFVQDEIRYMAMSDRIDGYKPENAAVVFARRFGDCKDKTNLAIVMLKALGIEAYPAVVNTSNGKNLNSFLPNPAVFRHVIAVAYINGKKYWVDLTQSFQGGNIDRYIQPNYHFALILDGKSDSLTKMPTASNELSHIEILERYYASQKAAAKYTVSVSTNFKGYHADCQRVQFYNASRKDITENCLKYFKENFPSAVASKEVQISDDRENNVMVVTEEYEFSDLWKRNQQDGAHLLKVYADEFRFYLSTQGIFPDRKSPIVNSHPRNITKKIELILPDVLWKLPSKKQTIKSDDFEFIKEEDLNNKIYSVTYRYKSLSDFIDTKNISQYIENAQSAMKTLSISLYLPDNVAIDHADKEVWKINWENLLLMFLLACALTCVAIKIYKKSTNNIEADPNNKLNGLGGWLILIGIGVCIMPFASGFLVLIFCFASMLPDFIADIYYTKGNYSNYLALFESIVYLWIFVFSTLIAFLFFKKKKSFVNQYVYFNIFCSLFFCLDTLLRNWLQITSEIKINFSIKDILFTAIWIAYMCQSERVLATFGCNFRFFKRKNES